MGAVALRVEPEVLRQFRHRLIHVGVALQVHILVLHVASQALDEDVVQGQTAPVHANDHVFALEHVRKGGARELRTLSLLNTSGLSCSRRASSMSIPKRRLPNGA